MIQLTKDQDERLKKFGRYLMECDADSVMSGGFVRFVGIRELIEKVTTFQSCWPKEKSGLDYQTAEIFAEKLGNDLMIVAMKHIQARCADKQVKGYRNHDKDNLDWHDVVNAGKLCELAWSLMYHYE